MRPVLVIGDLNADLILTGLSGHPRYGREVLVRRSMLTLGGSAAIFATGLARLGRKVKFLGKVGRDGTGDMLLAMMRRRGVDVSGMRRDPKVGTGIAVAFSETDDRALVSYLGTVAATTIRDVEPGDLRRYSHLHMTSPFLQLGLKAHFLRLLKRARKAGLTTSLDPGWDPRERWDLEALYPWIDVLLVNEVEASALAKQRRPRRAAQALAEKVGLAVVKTGPKGAVAASREGVWEAASFDVDPVDTTGAGDTFNSGFLDAWLAKEPVASALRFGCACGALSTEHPGGYEGQPTRVRARALLKGRA